MSHRPHDHAHALPVAPLLDRVVVRPAAAETQSAGGIILPDAAREAPRRGTVLATGPGRRLDSGATEPTGVAPGDEVLYARRAGTDLKVGGETLIVLKAADVLAKVLG